LPGRGPEPVDGHAESVAVVALSMAWTDTAVSRMYG